MYSFREPERGGELGGTEGQREDGGGDHETHTVLKGSARPRAARWSDVGGV